MIIFLYGKDTFRSRQQLKKMVEKFKADRDPAGYNVVVIDADAEKDSRRIMGEILTVPFLAERRMVVVESLLSVKHHAQLIQEILQRIEAKALSESTVLLFWEPSDSFVGKEAKALFAKLSQEKYCQSFDPLQGEKYASWIKEELDRRGTRATRDAVGCLASNTKDGWQAHTLIEQLTAYSGAQEITRKEVELFLDTQNADTIFSFVDAVVSGNAREAYRLLSHAYNNGEDLSYLFAMLIRQYRILMTMRDFFERTDTASTEVIAQKLSLHPFVVKKSLASMRRTPMASFRRVHRELTALDIAIKTGRGSPEAALDAFIGRQFSSP